MLEGTALVGRSHAHARAPVVLRPARRVSRRAAAGKPGARRPDAPRAHDRPRGLAAARPRLPPLADAGPVDYETSAQRRLRLHRAGPAAARRARRTADDAAARARAPLRADP